MNGGIFLNKTIDLSQAQQFYGRTRWDIQVVTDVIALYFTWRVKRPIGLWNMDVTEITTIKVCLAGLEKKILLLTRFQTSRRYKTCRRHKTKKSITNLEHGMRESFCFRRVYWLQKTKTIVNEAWHKCLWGFYWLQLLTTRHVETLSEYGRVPKITTAMGRRLICDIDELYFILTEFRFKAFYCDCNF